MIMNPLELFTKVDMQVKPIIEDILENRHCFLALPIEPAKVEMRKIGWILEKDIDNPEFHVDVLIGVHMEDSLKFIQIIGRSKTENIRFERFLVIQPGSVS